MADEALALALVERGVTGLFRRLAPEKPTRRIALVGVGVTKLNRLGEHLGIACVRQRWLLQVREDFGHLCTGDAVVGLWEDVKHTLRGLAECEQEDDAKDAEERDAGHHRPGLLPPGEPQAVVGQSRPMAGLPL